MDRPPGDEPITIAIPFVDGLAYLRAAIDSALALETPAHAIVVYDNTRSSDEQDAARSLISSYERAQVRWRTFGTHVPAAQNFNRILDDVDTDLVTLLHSDDELEPSYTDVMHAAARAFPEASAYYCDARIIDAQGRPAFSPVDAAKGFLRPRPRGGRTILSGESGVRALARANFIMCPTVCFRRSRLLGQRWAEDLHQVADLDLWTRLLFAGGTILGSNRVAFRYRRHASQTTSKNVKTLFRFREEVSALDLLARRADERAWRSAARTARQRMVLRMLVLFEAARDVARMDVAASVAKLRFLAGMR